MYLHLTLHLLAIIFIPRLLAFVEYHTLTHLDTFIITPVRIYRISRSSHLCISFEPETTIAAAMASVTAPQLPV